MYQVKIILATTLFQAAFNLKGIGIYNSICSKTLLVFVLVRTTQVLTVRECFAFALDHSLRAQHFTLSPMQPN